MKHADFVHLHNHSEYSLLDGANRIRDLVGAAREYAMPALAITDHGAMHGCIEFYKEAHHQGVKPILGCETYLTTGSRHDRTPSGSGGPNTHHLVLLAKNETGYRNLMKLTSIAFLEGFYYRPRIDKETLARHSEGLVALTACLKGEVPSLLLDEKEDKALAALGFYQEIFGPEDVYLEIQDHDIDEERQVIPLIRRLAARSGVKVVATNDCHYMRRDEAESHDILICIGTGKEYDDPKRLRMKTSHLDFKSPAEMHELFREIPEACRNTIEVAEKCNVELRLGESKVPVFPLPQGFDSEDDYLTMLSSTGLQKRYPDRWMENRSRLDYELGIIRQMGFSGYFLITQDFIRAAKERGIPVGPGRGSAAGSLVSYSLGITDVDPIRYGLLFERFLNPERISMPDIDIDFCFERRQEIIDYVVQKYGKESVAQIITFGRMASRAALRDVGRVLKVPFGDMDRIAKMVPGDPGMTLEKAFQQNSDLGRLEKSDAAFGRVLEHARRLEGLARHASTHAAGVVVAPGDLTDYVPLYKSNRDEITTQYDMKSVEEVGLLKMDFLGLRTLTVIHRALELISAKIGRHMTPEEIPFDDPQVYELLTSGETTGVFQFESSGMRTLLKNLKPSTFEDVMACTALYRPGPLGAGMDKEFIDRKHGRKKIEVLHQAMEGTLKETYGVILYQDQVMAIAAEMAGFTMGEADILRRAMGKKKPEEMAKQRVTFETGAAENGIEARLATSIFDLMEKFAEYGFNKSHSAAYALVAYQTAWLKVHYPAEFMAAVLSADMDNTDKVVNFLGEARTMQLSVLPPDINASNYMFEASDERTIAYGLGAVKGVGRGAVESIVEARRSGGAFADMSDFCRRVDAQKINKRVLEALILSG
ncbi:MAG TPA: DNA polymerase III subunit alpha, partial [bacterium]|nr:DNA polymerase III subunit alpha [bacterium]